MSPPLGPTTQFFLFPEMSESARQIGASYIDDKFFSTIRKCARTCLTMAARTASIVVDEFALHSLQINFDIGKSEFTIDLMGTDSAKIKTEFFPMDFPHIMISSRAYGDVEDHIATEYNIWALYMSQADHTCLK